jgi:PAS domain S-box-containing protein
VEEVIGKTDFDFFAPEMAGQFRNDEQTLMQKGQPLLNHEEHLVDATTGQPRWNLTSKIPRRDAQGHVIGRVGINRDITKRKQTEGMLRFSQFTLDHAATDITWIEPDARLFYVNESACRTLGYSREELLSMTIHDIQADPRSAEVWPLHWAELKQRGSFTFETQHRRKNGDVFPVEITVNYIEFDGKEYNCAFFRDITKRKGVEEELRYRVEFDRLITTISTQFVNLPSKDIDYGINYALQTIGEFAGVDRSYVFLYSNDHATMDNTHEWCASGVEPQIHKFKNFTNDKLSWSYQITSRGEVLYIPRLSELPPEASAEKEEFQSQDIQSLINVPMISGGVVVGFLGFDSVRQETVWSEERITLLKLVGEMFVSALERQRLEQQIQVSLERRTRQVQIGTEIAQNMANVPALSDLFGLVTSTIQERFGYYNVQIYLFEEGDLVLQEGTGEVGRQMKEAGYKISLSAEQNLAVRTVWSGEPVLVRNVSQEPNWLPNSLLPETKAELAVPINLGAEILGVLDVQSDTVDGVDEEDQLVLIGLCGQIAIAIESTRRGEQMQAALVDVKQSQELLRSIIDATPDRIFIKDQEYRYRLVNREYANSLYLTPDDFIGKTDLELGVPEELVKGDPEQGIRGMWADDRQVMDNGEPLFNQHVPTKAYGEVRMFNVVKVPLSDAEGRIWGVAGIARDVTEREKLLTETERYARREKTIREITEKMQAATSLEQLVKITARELGQRLGAGHAVVEMGIEPQTDNLTSFPNQSNNGH